MKFLLLALLFFVGTCCVQGGRIHVKLINSKIYQVPSYLWQDVERNGDVSLINSFVRQQNHLDPGEGQDPDPVTDSGQEPYTVL